MLQGLYDFIFIFLKGNGVNNQSNTKKKKGKD